MMFDDLSAAKWVIRGILCRSCRPGYLHYKVVPQDVAVHWLAALKRNGVKSILCLLSDSQLTKYYEFDLLDLYRSFGFSVKHIAIEDGQNPPVEGPDLLAAWVAFNDLPKPVLVHCSAGIDRTGSVVSYILRRLRAQRMLR